MRPLRLLLLLGGACLAASAQTTTIDVGSGSPSDSIRLQFVSAYYRGGFPNLVLLPPIADVKRFGTNGLVQEFNDAKATPGIKYALVMPNQTAVLAEGQYGVFQVHGGMYSFYTSVGSTTAGMPTADTLNCPPLAAANACQYQFFDKKYVLVVYKNPVNLGSTNFFTRDPFFTKWTGYGGISVLGPANSAETAVTSSTAAAATAQTYDRGAIYSYTTGNLSGKQIGVKEPVWSVYSANAAHSGTLGFPIAEELVLPNGNRRQSFENGGIEYDPATGTAVFRPAVATISIAAPSNPIRLKAGESVQLKALLADRLGAALTDRDVLWSTSDSRIVSIQAGGGAAVAKAVGGGSATIRASSEGKISAAITIIVTSQCCQVGEGAPTTALAQAFLDAVTRNRLSLKLPSANAVTRAGAGYTQQLETSDGQPLWIAVPDKVLAGYVLGGRLLAAWVEMGGPTGALGYPLSDATAGGRQMFEGGALAGDPVQRVTGDILAKWGQLGYETGMSGSPTGAPVTALTFRATRVVAQAFRGATLYAAARVYAVGGLILARYAASGGPAGRIGAPVIDEYGVNGRRRQDFEGGWIEYAPGDAAAELNEKARQPVVTATPASVVAGSRVRLAVGGFDNGATVRVSISGQQDFVVKVESGAYAWDAAVPANARTGTVTVRGADTGDASKSAQASYAVRAAAEVRLQLAIVRGDNQTGVPGALLPSPLRVAVKDESGNPVSGAGVQFAASPGARIEPTAAVTDENGEAAATLRLPANEGLALATARVTGQLVTFSARAAPSSLTGFPKFTQSGDRGAMVTAVAAIIGYHQSRGELPLSNGPADAAAIDGYLKSVCTPDAAGAPLCDGYLTAGGKPEAIVNLWRLGGFAGNTIDTSVEKPDPELIRDLVAQGSPVLLAMTLATGGAHFSVATGVAGNGALLIMDPAAAASQSLEDYLASGAKLTGAARLLSGAPKPGGFLVAVDATADITSPAGACGVSFEFGGTRLRACDGASAPAYQLDLAGGGYRGTFTDLGTPANRQELSGAGATSLSVVRANQQWTVTPLRTAITPKGIVNAASFTPGIAPGTIVSLFGAGFGRGTAVRVNGVDAPVFASFPFQVNFLVPLETPLGSATVKVSSEAGEATETIAIESVAPAIFLVGANQGAILNSDYTLNTPANPARRGGVVLIFGTGFGAVNPKGNLMLVETPVRVELEGSDLKVDYAGLAPGFVGLYQLNVGIPGVTAPGLEQRLSVRQGNSTSNTVFVAVQ